MRSPLKTGISTPTMTVDTETAGSSTGEGPESPPEPTPSRSGLVADNRGQTGPMNRLIGIVVAIGVALYVASALLIPAAQNYAGANKSNLTATQKTIAGLVTIFAVLGLAIAFINAATGVF